VASANLNPLGLCVELRLSIRWQVKLRIGRQKIAVLRIIWRVIMDRFVKNAENHCVLRRQAIVLRVENRVVNNSGILHYSHSPEKTNR